MRDLIVVGGGVTGAGVLRDASLRGLTGLLLEPGKPGGATTAASTHLIHGGIRYLLYDRLTTHATAWDAGNIVKTAAPLLKRLPIVWPVYRGASHGLSTVETLVTCYEPFQRMKEGLPHLRLSAAAVTELVPGLKTEGLLGGVSFDEWWVDAEGLTEANLKAAQGLGAEVRLGWKAAGLIREGGRVVGVRAEGPNGAREDLRAKVVVNAAGPWVDEVVRHAGLSIPLRLRKGTHLVYDKPLVPVGLLLEAVDRGRYVFVVPFPGGTLVGPTDLDSPGGPDDVKTTPDEVEYLRASVRRYFKDFPLEFKRTVVGARPILGQSGSEKLLSREYEIFDHGAQGAEGLVTAGGGKMSDFRLMAKDTVDLACEKLGKGSPCRTHSLTLAGQPAAPRPEFPRPSRPLKLFLRRHPRLRELHALSYLGVALARRLTAGGAPMSDAASFRKHYSLG
ncbi:MAG: glycerol-3-phosphate dehydrogenase [Elusimicrobia bacterium]|nr:MAG: glycerol-3-phosphate dehydrogenase [Elusimicrobiota bacterium]